MSRFQLSRYLTIVFLCVIAAAGWMYDRDIRQAEARPPAVEAGRDDSRTDCNGNGVADAFETSPLAGHALVFDGANDYAIPGSALALRQLGQGDFTLEAWVCTSDTRTNVLISNRKITPRLYYFVITNASGGGVPLFVFEDGESSYECTGVTCVSDGRWHHVAAVRSTAQRILILYVDGQVDAVVYAGPTSFTADEPTLIGRDQYASPHFFAGAMDEVRMWSVERSTANIVADMYSTLNGNEAGLEAYWRFDEGSGSIAYDSAGNHDGTLVGSPAWAQSLDDCNENAVPDECEVGGTEDCNTNSIPDLCDIYDGVSEDCNGNGVPDECETLPSGVIYVDDDATGGLNDGSNWADAHTDLQAALTHAECSGRISEIRVAGGTHKPGTSREDSFHMLNGVALRGGYRGLEGGGDPNERNTNTFRTTLSGDINDDDQWEWENRSDNSNHVVIGSNTDASAVLDGFTISGGYAEENGGGLYCEFSRLKLINCTFTNNWAAADGGGMGCLYGGPTLTDCFFFGNAAGENGGGLSNSNNRPTLTDCVFVGNTAGIGGALINSHSDATLTNCVFIGNTATSENHGGGAIRNLWESSPTLVGCVFSGNSGYFGGAIYNEWLSGPTIINCTFSGNVAHTAGGALYCTSYEPASAIVVNSIFWGNSAPTGAQFGHASDVLTIATYSCIQGGYEGVGNISVDPMLSDADGADNIFGTLDDDWHLLAASPCIDAGDDSEVPPGVTHDYDGDDRVQHCVVDMGADETSYIRVDCNENGVSDDCELEEGTSIDCNENGILDECDIVDCDGSAWCADCNANGVLDECDIENGSSPDGNPADGIPDECQGAPPVTGGCCYRGGCIVATAAACSAAGGEYQGDGTTCGEVECPAPLPGDIDGDCDVDLSDLAALLAQYGEVCGE